MPYLMNDEDLQKQTNAGQISGPSSVASSGGPQKPGQPGKSGQWTNLQTYMNANKDQAGQMGQKVAESADVAGKEAQGAINAFQSKVPTATTAYTAGDIEKNYLANPVDKAAYQNIKSTGGYSGPASAEEAGYTTAKQKADAAQTKIGNIQTEAGRQTELGNIYARPNYTQGTKTFDNLLLQNSPEARAAAQGTAQRWGNLQNTLAGAKSQADTVIPQNIATASANKQAVNAAEQAVIDKTYGDLSNRAADANAANASKIKQIQDDLATGDLTSKQWGYAGLGAGEHYYNLNPASYFNLNNTNLTANDVASDQERQYWQNLQNLIGGNDTRIGAAPTQVTPIGFDKAKFQSDLAAQDAAFKAAAANTRLTANMGSAQQAGSADALLEGGNTVNVGGGLTRDLGTLSDFVNSGMSVEQYVDTMAPGAQNRTDLINQMNGVLNQYGYNNKVQQTAAIAPVTGGPKFGGLK